jgi:uncharacterized membrane protein YgcG
MDGKFQPLIYMDVFIIIFAIGFITCLLGFVVLVVATLTRRGKPRGTESGGMHFEGTKPDSGIWAWMFGETGSSDSAHSHHHHHGSHHDSSHHSDIGGGHHGGGSHSGGFDGGGGGHSGGHH